MKRIEEFDMIKGILIIYVVVYHCAILVGTLGLWGILDKMIIAMMASAMLAFIMISGFVYRPKEEPAVREIIQRIKSLLLPYYIYCIPILVGFFIVYVLVEGRSLGWYADGLISILGQVQGTHFFSDVPPIHEMFYSAWPCWYIFQLAVAYIIFIPVQRLLKGKPRYMQILSALLLLALGAILYMLDLQGLNGQDFPMTTKIFILPNNFGFAGVLTIGKCLSEYKAAELTSLKAYAKIPAIVISLSLLIVLYLSDDYFYLLPLAKWGAFGVYSYFITPICGLALFFLLYMLCNRLKYIDCIGKLLGFFGKNSAQSQILCDG
ncbi:MAG: acyltransferase family protein [Eubacteriales bacterium]|nr:acyltransferase family protein [Eubacteriales bacterium]